VSKKTLYKYTGEYYGDIVLSPKVDSLNIVSNTKPLSLENKSVDNSKIELFTTNSIKAKVDEVNISNQNNNEQFEEKNDNKRKWLIAAGVALGAIAIGFGTRAILKNKNIINFSSTYKRALNSIDEIPDLQINEVCQVIFRPQNSNQSYFLNRFQSVKDLSKKIEIPTDIQKAIAKIENEAKKNSITLGVDIDYHFESQFEKEISLIQKFLEEKLSATAKLASKSQNAFEDFCLINNCSTSFNRQIIGDVPTGIISDSRIFYHGTSNSKSLYKEGFSLFKSNQIEKAPRELGEGIYLTPDKNVAAHFAGITGEIMHVKANIRKTAMITSKNYDLLIREAQDLLRKNGINYDGSPFSNASLELMIRKLLISAGYDSIYCSGGLAKGVGAINIDRFLGRNQSQLLILNPENAKIISKNFLQRITELLLQIKMKGITLKNTIMLAIKDPASLLTSL